MQLGICNVRIWWSQVLKQVLNVADSDSDKSKEVSQLQKPREQEENRNSSKVESTYWGVLFFGSHQTSIAQFLTCSTHPTHVHCAEAHWCTAQCKASYACILLVLKNHSSCKLSYTPYYSLILFDSYCNAHTSFEVLATAQKLLL